MTARPLWLDRERIVEEAKSSGITAAADVAALLDAVLRDRERRARQAAENGREAGRRRRALIREAIGSMRPGLLASVRATDVAEHIATRGADFFGFPGEDGPDLKTIRRTIKEMLADDQSNVALPFPNSGTAKS